MADLGVICDGEQKSKAEPRKQKALYSDLSFQVILSVLIAIVFGVLSPAQAAAAKPLGDVFIRMISMIITLVIFCTVTSGIAGVQDLKKVGRVGGKALLYFEAVSTLALLLGLVVGNVTHPGRGFNVDPATLNQKSVEAYAGAAKAQTVSEFLLHIVPRTVIDAFAQGDILQVVFIAVLFGFAISLSGAAGKPILAFIHSLNRVVFRVVDLLMRFAPLGAFGAMAFTIGKYGLVSLGPLARFMGLFYVTSLVFVFIILGFVCAVSGFSLLKLLRYIREEVFLVLATSSSEPALPTLMAKLEKLGCSETLVGLVVPTGYTFNTDGTSLYMTMAACFVAEATNTHLTLMQQLTILGLALLTSKGASGVQGAAFVALVGTLLVVPTIPVAGMALILGIDRFMAMMRAFVNMTGNAVATIVIARWERELDRAALAERLG